MRQVECGLPLCSPSNAASKNTVSPKSSIGGIAAGSCLTKKYGMHPMRGHFPSPDTGMIAVEGAQHPDMTLLLLARCAAVGNHEDSSTRLRRILTSSRRIGLKREIAKDQSRRPLLPGVPVATNFACDLKSSRRRSQNSA